MDVEKTLDSKLYEFLKFSSNICTLRVTQKGGFYMVRAVTIALILNGLIYNTAHNSLVTQLLASCVKDFHVDFSFLIGSLQMWILLVGAASTSLGHPFSKLLQQSLHSPLISSTIHMYITVTKMASVSPLHQIGDDERYLKQSCPV
jgi:hypothetical protein